MFSREQKLEAIYDKIADKTLSFGCNVKYIYLWDERKDKIIGTETRFSDSKSFMRSQWFDWDWMYISVFKITREYPYVCSQSMYNKYSSVLTYTEPTTKIIGHDVTIGDVLHWCKMERECHNYIDTMRVTTETVFMEKLKNHRKDYRQSIDIQSDDCIDFIYWLIDA